ncbi:ABC transporter permease [Mycolicibacterium mengxianglii]|uniref:ABC transporter permease n=1 Tax=Mycolicibacterium mengxianglii TaxID=2736649 RepID=UPI0018D05E92|nr:ABC transporter permease [Mycolicibacterium mengxianglii]
MSPVWSALAAERIKLFSTRAPAVAVLVAALFSLGLAALQASNRGMSAVAPQEAALGVAVVAVPVLMVVASMTVTAEYRTQMIRTTFVAVPNRTLVFAAKAVLSGVFAATATAIMVLAAVLVAGALAPPLATDALAVSDPHTWRTVGAFAVYAAVAATLGVGVGALIRAAPGTVAVLLLWPMVIETVLGILPETGARVGPYLPFANAYTFIEVQWLYQGYDMRWGPFGGLVYFVVVTAVVFTAALVVVNRRDA